MLFLALWGTVTLIEEVWDRVSRQLKYRRMESVSGNNLVQIIDSAKRQAFALKNNFYLENGRELSANWVKLQVRELAAVISSLHVKFCPHNKNKKNHMYDNFRHLNQSTVVDIGSRVSEYELVALLDLLTEMVKKCSTSITGDDLLKKDYDEMMNMLADLRNIIDFVKQRE